MFGQKKSTVPGAAFRRLSLAPFINELQTVPLTTMSSVSHPFVARMSWIISVTKIVFTRTGCKPKAEPDFQGWGFFIANVVASVWVQPAGSPRRA